MPRKPLVVTYTPNQFFSMMRDGAADRPSALWEFCSKVGIRNPPELAMNACDESPENLKWLRKTFGRIPSVLMSPDWDT